MSKISSSDQVKCENYANIEDDLSIPSAKNYTNSTEASVDNTKNTQGSGCFDVNYEDFRADKADNDRCTSDLSQNLQNSTIFDNEISEISIDSNIALDTVSDINDKSDTKNSLENSIFELSEEEKASFASVFPGININNIKKDQNFLIFAKGKAKSNDFSSLYADYLVLVKKIGEELEMRGKVAQNNKIASPGSLSSNTTNNINYFTKEQVLKMSKAQIAKNYIAIRESQQKW